MLAVQWFPRNSNNSLCKGGKAMMINRRSGLRVALIYLVFAVIWIFSSDWLWARFFLDEFAMGLLAQVLKGLAFVVVSALFIGWLAQREVRAVKSMQSELERKEASLSGIFEAHPLPLFVFDVETRRFLDVNQAAVEFYGYSKEEFMGMGVAGLHSQEELERLRKSLEDKRRYQKSGLWRHRCADGRIVWVDVFSHGIRYGGREARLVAAVDVTAQKTARERLVRALEEAALADQAKTNLLSSVSHELRTPLHGILGLTQLVLEEGRAGDAAEDLETIRQEAETLSERVDRLIEAADLESPPDGKPEKKAFNPRLLCEDLASLYSPICEAKGLRFESSFSEGTEVEMEGCPCEVRKILLNLLSNAVKFTEEGFVRLSLERCGEGRALCVSVEDTGIGVRESERKRVFEAFTQDDRGLSRRYPGSGLGLFLALGLAGKIGAELTLDHSEINAGSRFCLRLPLRNGRSPGISA